MNSHQKRSFRGTLTMALTFRHFFSTQTSPYELGLLERGIDIEILDSLMKALFCDYDFGINSTAMYIDHMTPPALSRNDFTSSDLRQVLKFPQLQKKFSLSVLHPKEGKHSLNTTHSLTISNAPRMKRLPFLCRGFLNTQTTTKCLVQQLGDFFDNLLEPYFLAEHWLSCIPANSHLIGTTLDCEVPIRIQTSRKVGFQYFVHGVPILHGHRDGGQERRCARGEGL
jgi:hypothetical protein